MMKKIIFLNKSAQAGIEYMIIIGFVTFTIISIFALAMVYSGQIKEKIKINQIEDFGMQLVSSAETVFFSGEPSKVTIQLYLPEGVKEISFEQESYLVITSGTGSKQHKRAFESKVPIQGSINPQEGIKRLTIEAKETYVLIN